MRITQVVPRSDPVRSVRACRIAGMMALRETKGDSPAPGDDRGRLREVLRGLPAQPRTVFLCVRVAGLPAHLVVGVLVLAPFLLVGWRHVRGPGLSLAARLAALSGYLVMTAAGAAGLYLLRFGAIRSNAWIVQLHVGLAIVGALGWILYLRLRAAPGEETGDEDPGGREAWAGAWRATRREAPRPPRPSTSPTRTGRRARRARRNKDPPLNIPP